MNKKTFLRRFSFIIFFLCSALTVAKSQEVSQNVISCGESVFIDDHFGQQRPAIVFARDQQGVCRTHILLDPSNRENNPAAFSQDQYFDLAAHYAPIWYQDTADSDYDAEYITNFNFDGNWNGKDNWENQPRFPLYAYIYYSVVETETHWFIVYANFHPRDWSETCAFWDPCHENDMEGVQVVIRKDGSEFGKLLLASSRAHSDLEFYPEDAGVIPIKGLGQYYDPAVGVPQDGSHPKVFVEAKGHGVYINHSVTGADGYSQGNFDGGDGVVYRYKATAEIPENGNDRDVSYALLPIEETLWLQRFKDPPFAEFFDYQGYRKLYSIEELGEAFGGDTHDDNKANPPWGWKDSSDENVLTGDWALDPAWTFQMYANFSHEYSLEYVNNFYFNFLTRNIVEINSDNASEFFSLRYVGPSGTHPDCQENDYNKWCIEDGVEHWPQDLVGCFEISDDSGSNDCYYGSGNTNTIIYAWNKNDYPYKSDQIHHITVNVMTKRSVCKDLIEEDDDGWEYFSQNAYILSLNLSAENAVAWQDEYCKDGHQHGPFRLKALFDANGYLDTIELRAGDHKDEGAFEVVNVNLVTGSCSDGTEYGECSNRQPLFCQEGQLVSRCSECGCPPNRVCQELTQRCSLPPAKYGSKPD